MKRYQKLWIIPAVIVIAVSILSGFSNPSAEKQAKLLLVQRTEILQKSFYNQITAWDAEKQLAQIETYPLLTEDIHSVRDWEATQLDIVKKMHIVSFRQEKNFLSYLTYTADIYWDMSGLSGNYTLKSSYYVVLKKENGQFKLSAFDPIED